MLPPHRPVLGPRSVKPPQPDAASVPVPVPVQEPSSPRGAPPVQRPDADGKRSGLYGARVPQPKAADAADRAPPSGRQPSRGVQGGRANGAPRPEPLGAAARRPDLSASLHFDQSARIMDFVTEHAPFASGYADIAAMNAWMHDVEGTVDALRKLEAVMRHLTDMIQPLQDELARRRAPKPVRDDPDPGFGYDPEASPGPR